MRLALVLVPINFVEKLKQHFSDNHQAWQLQSRN